MSAVRKPLRALLFPQPEEVIPGAGFYVVQRARVITLDRDSDSGTLSALQELVHGHIESIVMPLGHCGMVNDEGSLIDMPLNVEADTLWRVAVREGGMMTMPGDYTHGPCVVLGPADRNGDSEPVTDEFIALVHSLGIIVDAIESEDRATV